MQAAYRIIKACLALALLTPAMPTPADTTAEATIKAAIVYNVTKFISWPTQLQNLTLCTLGADSFNQAIQAVAGKTSRGRTIKVIAPPNHAALPNTCTIVYIHNAYHDGTRPILDTLKGKPILTISDKKDFAQQGGILELFKSNDRIRFAINRQSARRAGLAISSQLLNLAKIVH